VISPLGKAARVVAGLLFLGTAQTLLPQLWLPLGRIDLMMIAIGLMALRSSFAGAVWTGAIGGLIQDGLAGGIIGLHAFAKTAVAAALALLADFFAVRGQLAEAVIVGVATAAEAVLVRALLGFLGWPGPESTTGLLARAGVTGLACGIATVGVPFLLAVWRRRRRSSGLRWN
jgi:rod shape-determining protein MreD